MEEPVLSPAKGISDSFASAKPAPVLKSRSGPYYCVITIAAVRVSGMLAAETNCVSGGKL